jgi:hypothetical protein
MGMSMWASDHGDRKSWWTPIEEGGTRQAARTGSGWLEFGYLSNYLESPKILVCPSDPGKWQARYWGFGRPHTLFNAFYRDNAVSYIVGLHAVDDNPRSWLSADRNLRYTAGPSSCSTGIQNAWVLNTTDPLARWTNNIHGLIGNVLLNSGEVQTMDNTRLGPSLALHEDSQESGSGNVHFLPSF